MEKRSISVEEAKRRLRANQRLEDVVVEGNLQFDSESSERGWFLESVTIEGHLSLPRADLRFLCLRNVWIRGELDLSDALLAGGLTLENTTIGFLLSLWRTEIGAHLDLLGLKVRGIVVDSDLSELVHRAAPAVPQVIRLPDYN